MTAKIIKEILSQESIPLSDHIEKIRDLQQIIASYRYLKDEQDKKIFEMKKELSELRELVKMPKERGE